VTLTMREMRWEVDIEPDEKGDNFMAAAQNSIWLGSLRGLTCTYGWTFGIGFMTTGVLGSGATVARRSQ
jgi:hypothetical protein